MSLEIGSLVQVANTAYVGTVQAAFVRPDWGGDTAYVVAFEHDDPTLPPGGEFTEGLLLEIDESLGGFAKFWTAE